MVEVGECKNNSTVAIIIGGIRNSRKSLILVFHDCYLFRMPKKKQECFLFFMKINMWRLSDMWYVAIFYIKFPKHIRSGS